MRAFGVVGGHGKHSAKSARRRQAREALPEWLAACRGDLHMSLLTPFGVFLPELKAALVAAFFCFQYYFERKHINQYYPNMVNNKFLD
jgi:hypothetical protein